jgi:hypothetical protein
MEHVTENFARVEIYDEKSYGSADGHARIRINGAWFWPKDIDSTIAFLKDVKRAMKGKAKKLPTAAALSPATKQIWDHLKKVGSISNVEAQAIYRCRALPRRIKDIEESLGVTIHRARKQDATGQRYTRYSVNEF